MHVSVETFPLYSNVFRISGREDNMTALKPDPHAKPGRRPKAPPKEGATFDVELQRYVMSGERMTKQDKS